MSNPATMRLPPRRARFAWSKLAIAYLMNADGLLPETRINRQKNGAGEFREPFFCLHASSQTEPFSLRRRSRLFTLQRVRALGAR